MIEKKFDLVATPRHTYTVSRPNVQSKIMFNDQRRSLPVRNKRRIDDFTRATRDDVRICRRLQIPKSKSHVGARSQNDVHVGVMDAVQRRNALRQRCLRRCCLKEYK